jgi:hypothetical protein
MAETAETEEKRDKRVSYRVFGELAGWFMGLQAAEQLAHR